MPNILKSKFFCFNRKSFLVYIIVAAFLGVLAAGSSCFFFDCKGTIYSAIIDDFDSCANAGFPVVASDPPRCYISEEKVLVRDPKHIRIFNPKPNTYVTSPLKIEGEARALSNRVGYELRDENGKVLENGIIPANSPEHGRWGDYSKEVDFETGASRGTLDVFDVTPEDTRINVVSVPVAFNEKEAEKLEEKEQVERKSTEEKKQDVFSQMENMEIPSKLTLDVPFTSQAPYQDWDPPFDEACEEASAIMVMYYLKGRNLNAETANREIVLMADWQANQGYKVDVEVDELETIIENYYDGYNAHVFKNDDVTVENIKKLINAGYPVIIPAAGQLLGNPNFRGAGPPYHMLVITGFEEGYFYTNDPGTRNGESYKYSYETITNAIADWTGNKDTIEQGENAMLIIEAN